MEEQPGHSAEEVKQLQRCISVLVSVLALPAMWSGGDPRRIVPTLLDLLLGMLRLDVVYARLKDPVGDAPIELIRVNQSPRLPAPGQKLAELISQSLGPDPQRWPPQARHRIGATDMSIVPLRLGLQGEIGVVVAGSARADFPRQTERLLLGVAVNQAAIGLQEARLLSEERRVANELDQRVENRTRELAAANLELQKEIAERRLAEEALGEVRSELAHMARVTSLGALTASIAHEVNQPLSGIITNASTCLRMLAADPPNIDGARETARRTIRDGNRASDVIARLRALFGKKRSTSETVDLNEATREVIALSASELQRSRVVLQPELPDDLPPVSGDRVQLQQVVLNLIMNACEAMSGVEDRPRQLLVRTERDDGDRVRLTVKDAGAGFAPQGAEQLFQAFYTTKSNGMGMGLSVSRSIIESHHGRLWAAPNDDGPGATFSFSIPRRPERVTGAHGPGAMPTPAG